MRKFRLLSLLLIVTLIMPFGSVIASTPATSQVEAPTKNAAQAPAAQPVQAAPTPPERTMPAHTVEIDTSKLPDLSAEEIIAQYGRVPHALEDKVKGQSMMMVIELDEAPLAVYYAEQKAAAKQVNAAQMTAYVNQLKATQAKVQGQLEQLGVQVVSKPYTTVYNGFLAYVPLEQTNKILTLEHVKAVHRAPQHTVDLQNSVPLIGAPEVWKDLGYDGNGVTIAVIDTGIDYTHAALGGSGNPDDYATNDPDVVEEGTFPTVKVIAGYDYAGTTYNADPSSPDYQPEPNPDDDPLDENGHGTHVSSTAAGIAAGQVMTGVAPAATLMALKVFGAEGSTNLVVNALDDAVAHYLEFGWPQVINMSLGSSYGPGDIDDPDVVATNNAVAAGIVVAASIGNSANVPYIAGSPGTSSGAIGTAASTTGYATMPTVQDAGDPAAFSPIMYQPSAFNEPEAHYRTALTAPLAYVGNYTTTNQLCGTAGITPTNALVGKIALIQRGTCGFAVKARNAEALGAVGVLIYNSVAGGNALVTMADDGLPNGIPAGFVGLNDGVILTGRDGMSVTVSAEDDVMTLPNPYVPADTVADFSSRGPRGTDSKLKPDVTAPGVAIFAAAMGKVTAGVSYIGTSMASPHIAGVAALMVQAHPDWTPEQIKAAIMNTAVDLADGSPIPRQGAGRVRAYEAVNTPVVAVGENTSVSMSEFFVAGENQHVITRSVTLRNFDTVTHTYTVGWAYQGASLNQGMNVTFSTDNVTVLPDSEAQVLVTFTFDATQLPADFLALEEIYGYVTFTPLIYKIYLPLVMRNAGAGTATMAALQPQAVVQAEGVLRVPFYFVPRPYTELDIAAQTVIANPATDAATFEITHTGPISSSLWGFPLLRSDPQETGTAGDVRAFGADYGWTSGSYGPIIAFAIDAWAPWHTAHYYFAEFDLYIDNNEDGNPEFVIYNYPFGDGTYIPRIYALQADLTSRYSPYLIYTDYNSGYMEFYIPAAYLDLSSTNTTFDYQLFGFDIYGNPDTVAPGSFDFARPPFGWDYIGPISPDQSIGPGPDNHTASMEFYVYNLMGHAYSRPEGVMVVDYVGNPQNGGQAYLFPITLPNVDSFAILHTNDFHGQLEPSGSNPGIARVASVIISSRATKGADSVLLVDAGDEMQGSLLSNLSKGAATVDLFNFVGYQAATFGNHEFDWGQEVLISRTQEANYPFLAANLVIKDTGDCATAGWTSPAFAQPWITMTVGAPGHEVVVGLIGVTSQETPYITVAEATQGLCFKDAAESIAYYYDAVKAGGAEVLVVLSHLGNTDGGYGYGIPVYGDQTLAKKLVAAGKPVDLIIGGHSHTNLAAAQVVDGVTVVQAHYNGRRVGRADVVYNRVTGTATIAWQSVAVNPPPTPPATQPAATVPDTATAARLRTWTNDPDYQTRINEVIGYTKIDLIRKSTTDNTMGAFVNDAIYNELNNDAEPANDADMVFNNSGGLRADIIATGAPTTPYTLTYGALFTVLPFGNQTIVGDMTGAQIMELLNQSATLFKGTLQVAGVRFKYYSYGVRTTPTNPDSYHSSWWAWGAYDVEVKNGDTWEPLVMTQTYRVATNEFLAPAGQDGFTPFKYMTNISYWGDMLNQVLSWTRTHYGTPETAYNGPFGDGTLLDGRIIREGDNVSGPIIPVTILHHNDSHGNLAKGTYVGYTQLATLIKQERANNPTRTILLNGGDAIQGDGMMYYFKSAPLGYAADGTALPPELQTHPMMAVLNAMNYNAMVVGNHEYNFGNQIFKAVLHQANFPMLQANVYDTGAYGIADVPVVPDTSVTLPGPGGEDIKVAILGIGNHRVPNYELPSNIPGLTFTNPITEAQARVPALRTANDVVVALTHIGFTENPASIEVDTNVDTNLAAQTSGIDAIIGSHSHTDPSKQTTASGNYKYLPAIVGSPDNTPVIINQAYRYNNTLGRVVIGMRAKAGGGYEVASRAGDYLQVKQDTPEDAAIKGIVDPYVAFFTAYNNKTLGQTLYPIDTLNAYTEETNGANLQADASVWELAQHGINVDFHLSGAMSNRKVAGTATPSTPYTLTVADMFTLMPYENSLVTMRMNGPQLKAILERAYRNYYYYKYVPGYGGYSYYTTCMLDINAGGQITYLDTYPNLPDGNNVASLTINSHSVDFMDATTYYTVSTVNYLAAGSCNFNNGGVTLWPLDQIVNDTQYYVRDAVINYITDQGTIAPQVEGRLQFISGYELTVNTRGQGTVQADPPGPSYPVSTSVTLRALPANGWEFIGWSGDATGTMTETVITMDSNKTVTAMFFPTPSTYPKEEGIAYVSWWHGQYSSTGSDESLAKLVDTGAEWISLLATWYQDTVTSTTIAPHPDKTPTDADVIHAIQTAHNLGLKVMLKPHLDLLNDPTHWRGQIGEGFTTAAEWDAWFASYQAFINHYAQIAAENGVEQFSIGTELDGTAVEELRWRELITGTNGIRWLYGGPLVYAANHTYTNTVMFWDALDYIGIDAYYALATTSTATLEDFKLGWTKPISFLKGLAEEWNKPILFTEIGYRSIDGAGMAPWDYGAAQPLDMQEQADLYQAFFETVYQEPWFAGVFLWSWDTNPMQGGICDRDYTPLDKPAEIVLRHFFGGKPKASAGVLTPRPDYTGAANIYLDEALEHADDWSWGYWNGTWHGGTMVFTATDEVYAGQSSLRADLVGANWDAAQIGRWGTPLYTAPYYWLEFYIKQQNPNHALQMVFDGGNTLDYCRYTVAEENGWRQVRIPFTDAGKVNEENETLTWFALQTKGNDTTFWMDNIRVLGVIPVELSDGYTQFDEVGKTVIYTHILQNFYHQAASFTLAANSSRGWPVELRVGDAGLAPAGQVELGAGMTTTVQIVLTIPLTETVGVTDTTTLVATGVGDIAAYSDSLEDTTLVVEQVEITQEAGSLFGYTDTQGNHTMITVPATAATQTTELVYVPIANGIVPPRSLRLPVKPSA